MLKHKFLFTFVFSMISVFVFAQEICNNGIDDDGDNLIDLNDTECSCNSTLPFTFVQDFLCNPNFGLTLEFDCPGATSFQWYQDGVAVLGETTNTIIMFEDPLLDGDYVCVAQKTGGCVTSEIHTVDSEVFLDLGDIFLCDGDTIKIGAFDITEAGTWQGNNKLTNGCDSITRATIFIVQREIIDLYDELCNGGTYVYNGKTFTQPGYFSCRLPNIIQSECDTLVRITLSVSSVLKDTIYGGLCDGECFTYSGIDYCSPGEITIPITNTGACDSLITLYLSTSMVSDTTLMESICSGESIIFDGQVLSASGSYLAEETNAAGCDSLVTMILTVNDIVPYVFSENICEGDTFKLHGICASLEGIYSDTLTAPSGCDSIITVNLSFTAPIIGAVEDHAICEGETFTMHGISATMEGIYTDTISAYSGCDSIIFVNLSFIAPSVGPIEDRTICEGDSTLWNGMYYSLAGIYFDTIQASMSVCDSINTLNLNTNNEIPFSITDTICEGEVYMLHSINTSVAGQYMTTILSSGGCDSVITVDLVVGLNEELVLDQTFCEGETFDFGGALITTGGTYYDTLMTHLGCDSTIILNLGQLSSSSYFFRDTICFGDMYTYNDIATDMPGMHETVLTAANGCDSIVSFDLTVSPLLENTFDAKICSGDFFEFGDIDPTEEGEYERRFSNAVGCDSVVTLRLTVVEPSDGVELGDSYEISFGETTDITPDYLDPNLSNIEWTDQNGEDLGSDDHVPDFGPLLNTYVYFSAIDGNGCLTTDTILIRVDLDINLFIPNTFSPNGDGQNDNFTVFSNPSVTGIKEIQVYDRWGELMYEDTHPEDLETYIGWDGRFKDTMCKPGVFVYSVIFDIIDGSEVKKSGTITLVR